MAPGRLAGTGSDALFFAGDLGQRSIQQPFSWNQYGVSLVNPLSRQTT